MITDEQVNDALTWSTARGIEKQEIRSYEVSLWTLQDEFISVLKWSNVEQKGRIESPSIVLNNDSIDTLDFKIPMYLQVWDSATEQMQKVENPIWYNTTNGNLIEGLRKIKVIFNKQTAYERVFEFLITEVKEEHTRDQIYCSVKAENQIFHELGKIGYKVNLSQANFELVYEDWIKGGAQGTEPIQNIDYWCTEAGLAAWPGINEDYSSTAWYYVVHMDWSSYSDAPGRKAWKIYEEPYVAKWNTNLQPTRVEQYREKARPVEISDSNIYNITQKLAEVFQVHCRYTYGYDENYHIKYKLVEFYNNYYIDSAGILSFTYPYDSSSIVRKSDSSAITSKLFVKSVDDSDTVVTIMDSELNDTKEDYVLNFDYLYECGAISDQQYAAIDTYKKAIRAINDEIMPLEYQLEALADEKTEVDAQVTTLTNALALDKEQLAQNTALSEALDAKDGTNDSYITIAESHPDTAVVMTSTDTGKYYINAARLQKGIDISTLHIYRTYTGGSVTNEITQFVCGYNEYNNLDTITFVNNSDLDLSTSSLVYLTYQYKPKLYYDNVITMWETKIGQDSADLETATAQQQALEETIAEKEATLGQSYLHTGLYGEKATLIQEFEHMMGPALREGYWSPEGYTDYGDGHSDSLTITQSYANTLTNVTSRDTYDVVFGWDIKPFTGEEELKYKSGILQTQIAYPCINLAPYFSTIKSHLSELSFIYDSGYVANAQTSDPPEYQKKSFSVGSKALLRFAVNSSNPGNGTSYTVIPILVLVGAQTMSTAEINAMKQPTYGNPRLGIVNGFGQQTTVLQELSASDFINVNSYTMVYPRIKFNTAYVKVNDLTMGIIVNNSILLEQYEDYSIRSRRTVYADKTTPEYYVTIKPEKLMQCMTVSNSTFSVPVTVIYNTSTIASSIYIDALQVAKENSQPKVTYELSPLLLRTDLTYTLYNNLNRIILISDTDLKLSDAYGYISKITLDLDHPWQDRIEVSNYSNKFEDIFSSIVAQTEAMKNANATTASIVAGNITLSNMGLTNTLSNNSELISEYIRDALGEDSIYAEWGNILGEAGSILADAAQGLTYMSNLTTSNSSYLSGFAAEMQRLAPVVVTSETQPLDFKPGDIWIQPNVPVLDVYGQPTEETTTKHYVATGNASNASDGYGYTLTKDGTLACIKGTNLSIDADAGKIDVIAENQINIESGHDVYIGANSKVEIVGNESVNIGGTTINIVSESAAGDSSGGINLIATNYIDNNNDNIWNISNPQPWLEELETNLPSYILDPYAELGISKVLIQPASIFMGSASITMVGGQAANNTGHLVSAMVLDPDQGVFIGSTGGVRLYGGNAIPVTTETTTVGGNTVTSVTGIDTTTTGINGASVELNSDHLIMGFSDIQSASSGSVIRMDHQSIVFGVGTSIANSTLTGTEWAVTGLDSGLIGMRLKKDSFGLAVKVSSTISTILANNRGVTIGSGTTTNLTTSLDSDTSTLVTAINNGAGFSFVRIAGEGIYVASTSSLKVDTGNFFLDTSATGTNPILKLLDPNDSNSPFLTYSLTNGLVIRGQISANSLIIGDGDNQTVSNYINAKVTPQAIWLGVKNATDSTNASYQGTSIHLTDSALSLDSTGSISITGGQVTIASAGKLTITGESYIQAGTWILKPGRFYTDLTGASTATMGFIELNSQPIATQPYGIWLGAETATSAPFRVHKDGTVYMTKLVINGTAVDISSQKLIGS